MKQRASVAAAAISILICTVLSPTLAAEPPTSRSGEEIYIDKCVYCHAERGWGTRVLSRRVPEGQAELTERENLPAAFTKIVVRQGIGSMPPFTPTDLTDEEIAVVAAWLENGG